MITFQKLSSLLKILENLEKPLIEMADSAERGELGLDSKVVRLLDDAINDLAKARSSLVRVRSRLR